MLDYAHISYSGVGGLAEVALSLLGPARHQPDRHRILFYGCEDLPEVYENRCRELQCHYDFVAKREGLDWRSLRAIRAWLDRYQPDVVISHMPQTIFATLPYLRSNPAAALISVEHTSNALKTPKDWALSVVNHWGSGRSVLLTQEYLQQMQGRMRTLLRTNRIELIPNGVDTARFSPREERRSVPAVLGMQARMVEGKDYVCLLRVFSRLADSGDYPDLILELAGDGPDRKELEQLVRQLGIENRVTFLGMLPQDELIERMRNWDIFTLVTEGETMSRAIMEAQALGLPVIATRVSGVTAAIEDGENGWLVPFGDDDALLHACKALLSDADLRESLGQTARAHAVANFSVEQTWDRYRTTALSLLSQN